MPLDGATLSQIRLEIENTVLGHRVEKIHQPSREEIVLHLRGRQGTAKLLINVGAASPRVHLTELAPENPQSPPMFCMLLRKHLGGARLVAVEQPGLERVLRLGFEAGNEFGDRVSLSFYAEIMGRHSNGILVDADGRVVDSAKRVDATMSSVRRVLPGMDYSPPPPQPDKINLLEADSAAVIDRLGGMPPGALSKQLLNILQGFSPLICREIAHFALAGGGDDAAPLTEGQLHRLSFYLDALAGQMRAGSCKPVLFYEGGELKDYSLINIEQYGALYSPRVFESFGAMLDAFYSGRDTAERMKQRGGSLLQQLHSLRERIARRLDAQREELLRSADREQLKIMGDLLSTYLHMFEKGADSVTVQNYYDPDLADITVQLDPLRTPVQNAQRYYHDYRRAATAEKKLYELIAEGEREYEYVESVLDALGRATTEGELDAIRAELAQEGYLKQYVLKKAKPQKLAPLKFVSSDGFVILVGRNNTQNDRLTLKDARGSDIWLHTQNIPGSHVVVLAEGGQVPDRTLEQAAILAAVHSRARASSKVAVDYTEVKNVKKPRGAKPGMVIYETYKTAIVDPDEALVQQLKG